MAIVTIFSSVYCHGEDVERGVVAQLGYSCLKDDELFRAAASRFPMKEEKLSRALYEPPAFLNSMTRNKEKGVAYLRAVILDCLGEDDLVYRGFAGHLLPDTLTHVLRVCLVATQEYRIDRANKVAGLSQYKAKSAIQKVDGWAALWTETLFDSTPFDKRLYDIVLPMHMLSVRAAVDVIAEQVEKPVLHPTAVSSRSLEDARLAARVSVHLVQKGHDVDVTAVDGRVSILVNQYSMRLTHTLQELTTLAKEVEGVREVDAKPGPRYREPGIYMPMDEIPVSSRVLLVDDEKEFVQTLSERLRTRDFDTAIAYDGEEALERVAEEEHDVLVLDLKMPGIDGIEVLRRVKRGHPGIEVIILTGHGSDREREQAEALGVHAYLRKPVDIDVLTEKMRGAYAKIARRNSQSDDEDQES